MANKFPEDEFDDENEFDDANKDEIFYTEDEYNDLLDENIELKNDQLFVVQKELNEKILNDAIIVCSKSFFWYFKTYKVKIREIKNIYMKFLEMTENNIDPIKI